MSCLLRISESVVTCAIPGAVTNSVSTPSSVKYPSSRATITARSWTAFMIASRIVLDCC